MSSYYQKLVNLGMRPDLASLQVDQFGRGGLVYNVKDYGAVADGVTNDSGAIQDAIDAASAAGGGTVFIPGGTYIITGIIVPSFVNLIGVNAKRSVLKYSSTSGSAVTLQNTAAASSYNAIIDLKIQASTTSSGNGITSQTGYVLADTYIDRFEIEGFLKGVYIPYGLQTHIGFGRLIGRGKAVAGGVGVQLGDRTLGTPRLVNIGVFNQCYSSSYETNFISDGNAHVMTQCTSEDCVNAINCASHLSVIGCWVQATTKLVIIRASGGYPCEMFGCYYLNGSSSEVDDVSTMADTNSSPQDLSILDKSEFKGAGPWRMRFATSAARGLQLGSSTPVTVHSEAGSAEFAATTRPLQVDRDESGTKTLFGLLQQGSAVGYLGVNSSGNPVLMGSGGANIAAEWDNNKNFIAGGGVLATTSTTGMMQVPTCAGTPTGAVNDGCIVIDTTNHKLYFMSGGTWRDAGP